MSLKTVLNAIVCSLILTGCTNPSYLPLTEDLGIITNTQGVPRVIRNARPYILAKQSRLFTGDVVITANNATATLKLADGTVLRLAPASRLLIRGISHHDRRYRSELTLNEGSMEISGIHPGSKHLTSIAAATASVNLRAGNLWLNHRLDDTLLDVVLSSEGEAQITNSHGSVTLSVPLATTTVPAGAAPRPQVTWTEQKFKTIRDRRMTLAD